MTPLPPPLPALAQRDVKGLSLDGLRLLSSFSLKDAGFTAGEQMLDVEFRAAGRDSRSGLPNDEDEPVVVKYATLQPLPAPAPLATPLTHV